MAIGNMHQKFCKDSACDSGHMLTDRHMHTHAQAQTDVLFTILCHCSHGPSNKISRSEDTVQCVICLVAVMRGTCHLFRSRRQLAEPGSLVKWLLNKACVCVADIYSRPYGSSAVTPLDYTPAAVPAKPYEDSYAPTPSFSDVDASPRKLGYVGQSVIMWHICHWNVPVTV